VTTNWLVPLGLFGCLLVVLPAVHERLAAVSAAALVPMAFIALVFAFDDAPYIKQSLGLSHLTGRAILVVIPGLLAAGLVALRRRATVG